MIPRLKPTLGWGELAAAWTPAGAADVERFEGGFAELMGQRHAIAFPYGRTGLMLLLEALGLKDREVICPAYTCVVVAHAIVLSGNRPVFVDCAAEGFNMDLDQAEAAITDHTGALIATSLFGYPVDLDRLDGIRRRNPGLVVVQDCAHSFAAEWQGRPVQRAGDAAFFGLNISKLITSVFGGMVTTDNADVAGRLRAVRGQRLHPPGWDKGWRRRLYLTAVYPAFSGPIYGTVNRLERLGLLDRFVKYYDDAAIDMPADHLEAMTGVEARVGGRQLRRYHGLIGHRREIAALYDRILGGIPSLRLPPLIEGATYSHYVPCTADREAILEHALSEGVQLGRLIEYSVPELTAYQQVAVGGAFPNAGRLAASTLNLPLHVGPRDARRVAGVVARAVAP